MATIEDVKVKLNELSEFIPLTKELKLSDEWLIHQDNKLSFPNSEYPGVYIFTNQNSEIIYIGKASSGLGVRLGNGYINKTNDRTNDKIITAKSLFTIRLEKTMFFLAPAIEEYLIRLLDPSENVIGRRAGSKD